MKKLLDTNSKTSIVSNGRPFIQPKLTINQPNDVYEQEADAMADKVMRMQQPFIQEKALPVTAVQRKCAHCEEEEKKAQRKEMNSEETEAGAGLENYIGSIGSGGTPLSDETKSFYEPRFGYDFSNVRIHTDTVAAKSAHSINALAYTSGNNIVFNSGQYSPNTDSGKRLLGHELTHVVQQNTNISPKKIQRWSWKGFGIGAGVGGGLGAIAGGIIGGVLGGPLGAVGGALLGGLAGSLIGGLIGGAAGSAPEKRDAGSKEFAEGSFDPITGLYIIAPDDNLNAIAARLEISVTDIIKDNPGISLQSELMPGDALFISAIILPSIPRGKEHAEWDFYDYIDRWEKIKGRSITPVEKKNLARGCIGITEINTGKNPLENLGLCYTSFAGAIKKAKELFVVFKAAGVESHKKLSVFSKRFYQVAGKNYPADNTGLVDMSAYESDDRVPGHVNFDYGFYDVETGMWWHANHCDPVEGSIRCAANYDASNRMYVYESSLDYYSRDLEDFNQQVFCVAIQDI